METSVGRQSSRKWNLTWRFAVFFLMTNLMSRHPFQSNISRPTKRRFLDQCFVSWVLTPSRKPLSSSTTTPMVSKIEKQSIFCTFSREKYCHRKWNCNFHNQRCNCKEVHCRHRCWTGLTDMDQLILFNPNKLTKLPLLGWGECPHPGSPANDVLHRVQGFLPWWRSLLRKTRWRPEISLI